jgi:hypothetical protein
VCNTPRHSSWRDVCAAGAWLLSNISAALSRSKATQKCFVYCLKSKALPVCLSVVEVVEPPVAHHLANHQCQRGILSTDRRRRPARSSCCLLACSACCAPRRALVTSSNRQMSSTQVLSVLFCGVHTRATSSLAATLRLSDQGYDLACQTTRPRGGLAPV